MDGTDDRSRFDDDRLLGFALGLGPDMELEAALAGDDALRARLEAVRADLAAVEQGLARSVPVPPDDYTDLGGERWAELKPLLQAPAAAPQRRRSWLRVLAPVAAVVLVLGVGVVALQRSGTGGQGMSTAASDNAEKATPGAQAPALGGATSGGAQAVTRDVAAEFGLIVVGRAQAPAAAKQAFTVEKALKGEAPATVMLEMIGSAIRPDALAILYLLPATTSAAESSATAKTLKSSYGTTSRYRYRGSPAYAQPLPPGTDPATVTLP